MKKLTLLLVFIISAKSFSQTKNFIDLPYIETSAIADTLVLPNRIHLNIMISEKDSKDKYSVEELENLMEQKLKGLGINTNQNLSLNDLASNFKKYFIKETDVMKSKSYNLIVENAKIAGSVIAELETIEISNIRVAKTENTEYEKIKLILKSSAIAKAKIQAEFMTKPLKQKVGIAIFISDLTNVRNYDDGGVSLQEVVVVGYSSKRKQEFKPIDIEFQKIKIESIVNVKFKLE
jgi:predicted PolB exonuclease-like 3'-5' exonuclease